VHVDAADLATSVAGELIARLEDAQARGEVPHIGLTGGTIAIAVHEELGRMGPDSDVDWRRVVLWWGDERFVAADSEDRNERQAMDAFGGRLPFDPAHVHAMPSTDDAASVDEAAAAYSATVRSEGTGFFEVLMLGVGPDGHVASLFPGSSQLDATDAIAVGVTDSPKPPPERVTLTYEAMDRCRSVWFLVSGAEKADAVARALAEGTDKHDIPAVGVTGELETLWFLDRASASQL
jgi:6-phosphogluconolactonase